VIVVDPRRSRTAEEADEHHFIRPGTDACLLFAILHTLFAQELVAPGRLAAHTNGIERVRELARPFTPEAVASVCGIAAKAIYRITRELARAPRAAVYGRVGTCTQEFGTLTSWLIDVINILTGNLDREGGAMFPKAAAGSRNTTGTPGCGRGVRFGRWRSRVRGLPETYGELPVACLVEEIETPGEGQVRGLITVGGNPVLSTPDSGRLQRALEELGFMVSVDVYLNETTRHAHVILPAPSLLARSHYDLAFYQLSVRNIAHYSPPIFELDPGEIDESEILLKLIGILTGQGPNADASTIDDFITAQLIQREVETVGSRLEGRDPQELLAALQPQRGPERALDFMLRSGPYGDAFGKEPSGLTLDLVKANPHGIDLGPLEPRIPEVLRTPSGKIELAPEPIVADVERLRASLNRSISPLVLIGRRQLRSNNSWMHNLNVLVKGNDNRCTLQIHPDDAARFEIADGEAARVTSRVGSVEAPVEITDAMMPGVISLPHGWGHSEPGTSMRVAALHAGVNSNRLADEAAVEPLSGAAILNGIAVTVEKVTQRAQSAVRAGVR
jgi:anaerobic selenocysteine-containing dehydrogenase